MTRALLSARNEIAPPNGVYRQYGQALTRYARRLGAPDPGGIANLAVFDAVRNLPAATLQQEKIVKSYLYRAAHGRTIDDLRRVKPVVPVDPADIELPIISNDLDLDASIRLDEALEALSEKQAAVIVARFLQDKSAQEIAEQLGTNPNTVYQIQHRALARLRVLMAAALGTGSGFQGCQACQLADPVPIHVIRTDRATGDRQLRSARRAHARLVEPSRLSTPQRRRSRDVHAAVPPPLPDRAPAAPGRPQPGGEHVSRPDSGNRFGCSGNQPREPTGTDR